MSKPKYRNVVLILMFIAWIVCYMDRMVMSLSIPYISKEFGMDPVTMGVVMSAFMLGYALMQLPGGILADKTGPKAVMVFALLGWSVMTGITGLATTLAGLLVIRLLFGFAEGFFPGSYYKIIAVWFPIKERASANGLGYSAQSFGMALAAMAGGVIITGYGWRMLYFGLMVSGLIIAIFIACLVADSPFKSRFVKKIELEEIEGSAHPNEEDLKSKSKLSYGSILKMPVIWMLALTWFFIVMSNWGFISWLPSYLVKERGFASLQMGFAVALPFLASAAGLASGGFISDKLFTGRRKVCFSISMFIAAAVLLIAITTQSASICLIAITISGYFLSVGMAGFWAIPMTSISKDVMGLASSTISFFGTVGGFIAPVSIGFLIKATGNYNVVLMQIMFGLLLTIPCMLLVRTPDKGIKSNNQAGIGSNK